MLTSSGEPYIVIISKGKWLSGLEFKNFNVNEWDEYAIDGTRFGTSSVWYVDFPDIKECHVDIIQFKKLRTGHNIDDYPEGSGTFYWDGEKLRIVSISNVDTNTVIEILQQFSGTRVVLGPCERQVHPLSPQ